MVRGQLFHVSKDGGQKFAFLNPSFALDLNLGTCYKYLTKFVVLFMTTKWKDTSSVGFAHIFCFSFIALSTINARLYDMISTLNGAVYSCYT